MHRFGFSSYEGAVRGSRRLPKRNEAEKPRAGFPASFRLHAKRAGQRPRCGDAQSWENAVLMPTLVMRKPFHGCARLFSAPVMRKCRTDAAKRFNAAKHGARRVSAIFPARIKLLSSII